MPIELANILWGALGLIVTSLITWGFFLLRSWVTKKMGNNDYTQLLNKVLAIIEDVVKEIFQTYVEALKKDGKFTEECHKKAKEMAMAAILNRLTPELRDFIEQHFGDIRVWISNQIETCIYTLKQN